MVLRPGEVHGRDGIATWSSAAIVVRFHIDRIFGPYEIQVQAGMGRRGGAGKETGAALPPDSGMPDPAGQSIYSAIQRQMGLKLETQKAPVDVIVIDRVEKPSEN